MRRPSLLILTALLLTACAGSVTSITEQNKNPLTAQRYGEALANTMANIIIKNDPLAKESGAEERIRSEITRGKSIAAEAERTMSLGMAGAFVPLKQEIAGMALFIPGNLYFSPDFLTDPGPSIRVYLTTIVDPRDGKFPDATALDLGPLQSAFGAQTYPVPDIGKPERYRTVVLLETTFQRLYSFAQLSKQRE